MAHEEDQFLVSDHLTITDISVGPPLEISDHCEITCLLKIKKNTNKAFSRSVWDYNKADWEGLNTSLSNLNWDDCFTAGDVSSCAQLWTETFLSYARRFIPNKLITIRPWDKSWYNNGLRSKKRKRDRTFKIAKRSNTTSDWTKYRQCRNEYVHTLEAAENEFKQKQINKIHSGTVNHRSWWQTVKTFISWNKTSSIPALICDNGITTNNSTEKANLLKKSF